MKVIDVIKSVSAAEIIKALKSIHDFDEYEESIAQIIAIEPKEATDDRVIIVTTYMDEFDGKEYSAPSMKIDGETYSTSFMPISIYLGLEVDNQSNEEGANLAAILFYDMTFFGYEDSQVNDEADKLNSAFDEAVKEFDFSDLDKNFVD